MGMHVGVYTVSKVSGAKVDAIRGVREWTHFSLGVLVSFRPFV